MLKIECPFCGKLEEKEFRQTEKVVHHSIVCDECKLIEKGRMTIVHMLTAISVILGSDREILTGDYLAPLHLISLQRNLKAALHDIDIYLDEIPF